MTVRGTCVPPGASANTAGRPPTVRARAGKASRIDARSRPGCTARHYPGLRRSRGPGRSHIEVQVELPRVGAEANLIQLAGSLELDPGVDDVLGEDPALQQER